jgi:GTP-binding protein
VVRVEDRDFVVADIPGLIEGASDGRGLGHQFLRHIERASVLALLVDLAATAEVDPAEQERVLLAELEHYRPDLLARPRIVVGSRADLAHGDGVGDACITESKASTFHGDGTSQVDHVEISSVTGAGLPQLVGRLADLVDEARDRTDDLEESTFVVHRPAPENIAVERVDAHTWRVLGRPAERAVSLSDVRGPEALAYIQHRLTSLGVDRALVRSGVADGDTVCIADYEFDYQADR